MTLPANSGKFESTSFLTSKAVISVNTPRFSVDLEARPISSSKDTAPSHELWGPDPRGVMIQWGVMFPRQSKKKTLFFNIIIEAWNWKANLFKDTSQENETVAIVLPWTREKKGD